MRDGELEAASALSRRQFVLGAVVAGLPLGALACSGERKDGPLLVGGLPVTCNPMLPVACRERAEINRLADANAPRFEYEYSKYNGWPEIKKSLMAGRIQAA
jgi:NitT/TauT family transport system substrate-binding protein